MSNRTCSFGDCLSPVHCKGFCRIHYTRFRIHGDPSVDLHRAKRTAEGLKICKKCEEAKPESEFHKDGGSPDGFRAQCKPCRNGYMREYYLSEDPDVKRERLKQYRLDNADRLRSLDAARYERDKDKRVALSSEQIKVRRARLAGVETDPGVTVRSLRELHGDACCYCGIEMSFVRRPRGAGIAHDRATLEHIVPISRGGTHTFDNTALACHRCNVSKNDKTLEEYEAWKAGVSNGRKEAAPACEGSN